MSALTVDVEVIEGLRAKVTVRYGTETRVKTWQYVGHNCGYDQYDTQLSNPDDSEAWGYPRRVEILRTGTGCLGRHVATSVRDLIPICLVVAATLEAS